MKLLILTASLWALVAAKPELYREKEDFEYSRSSSDDGTKAGYYGAQRGNMGGNYERAHNMDSLAQHQMSTLVRNVEGELGEGANTRAGSVYSAALSRGLYGSGNYDLSNLRGRNFGEGTSYADSLSQSNLGYSGYGSLYSDNAKYINSHSQSSGLRSSGLASQYLQTDAQKADASGYQTSGLASQYSQTGAQKASGLINATPVRIYIRPGTRVAIPVAAQVYETSADQNAINTNSDTVSGQLLNYKPTSHSKNYESSYSYRKEWEKKHVIPVTIASTENPFPPNSELYEDAQSQTANNDLYESELAAANSQSSSANSAYSSGYSATNTASASQARHQSQTYNSGAAASNAYSHNAYDAAAAANLYGSHISDASADSNKLIEDIASKPKSYHSSYSYHKSWERRGDPYVIKPAGDVTSQRLTAASANPSYVCTYCIDDSQQRVRRSLDKSENLNDGQKKSSGLSDGQKKSSGWGQLDQETHDRLDRLRNFGQQTQSNWGNLENFGRQNQDPFGRLDNFGQQTQSHFGNLGNFGRQNQDPFGRLDNFGQQTQSHFGSLENFGRQNQDPFGRSDNFGQHTQSHFGNLDNFGQQSQSHWGNLDNFGQQTQSSLDDFGRQTQDKLEDFGQRTQSHWGKLDNFGQQTGSKLEDWGQNTADKLENFGEQSQNNLEDWGQKTADTLENFGQKTGSALEKWGDQTANKLENFGQQAEKKLDDWVDLEQHVQPQFYLPNFNQETQHIIENTFGGNQFYMQHPWTDINERYSPYPTNYRDILYASSLGVHENINNHNFRQGGYYYHSNFDFKESQSSTQKSDVLVNSIDLELNDHSEMPHKHTVQNTEEKPLKKKNYTQIQREATRVYHIDLDETISKTTQKTSIKNELYAGISTPVNQYSIDTGRGDIGAEDTSIDEANIYNTPEEIESFSLTKDDGNTFQEPLNLSVTSINKQSEPVNKLSSVVESITTSTAKSAQNGNMNDISIIDDSKFETGFLDNDMQKESKQTLDSDAQQDKKLIEGFENYDQEKWAQQTQNIDQQYMGQHEEPIEEQSIAQNSQAFGEQDIGQHLENFGIQNVGEHGEPNKEQLEQLEHQLVQQLQKSEEINWVQENVEQLIEPLVHKNIEQLEAFTQKSVDQSQTFEQQNDKQFEYPEVKTFRLNDYREQIQMPDNEYRQENLQTSSKIIETNQPNKEVQAKENVSQNVELPKSAEDISAPIEPSTEKPGFWSKLWNKTKSAKESVVSWFRS